MRRSKWHNYPHGMNWIFLATRMAIYARDHFDCVWCRQVFPVDPKGYGLTLDHLDYVNGNAPTNLVTACPRCNTSRRAKGLDEWLRGNRTRRARMKAAVNRPIDRALGRVLAAHRKGAPIAPVDIEALRRVAGHRAADAALYGATRDCVEGGDGW